MRKNFTLFLTMMLVCVGINVVQAQTTLWPTADSATIRASQFSDSTRIFKITKTATAPPTGFTGWTSKPLTCADPAKLDSAQFVWTLNSKSRGAYSGTTRSMFSPTSGNGMAFFDSNWYDDRGDANAPGAGPAPSPHSAELISPVMNIPTTATDVTVDFHQYFRRFSGTTTKLNYSMDGGTTWSADFFFNPESEVVVNGSTTNPVIATNTDSTKKRVVLFGSKGSANFRIKFTINADYYFWVIDDVKIIDYKAYDMRIETGFYAIPPSAYTPKEQLDTIRFLADVRNLGTIPMANVKLQVKVWRDADKALVYSSTSSQYPASFKADTAYENRILPDRLPPSALSQVGKYFGSYRVLGDSSSKDVNPANDTIRFDFWVSDTANANSLIVAGIGRSNYTKEDNSVSVTRLGNGYWTGTEPRSVRYGNYYRINKAPATITTLMARLNPIAARNKRIQASIYEWKDANNDDLIQATERVLVAAADSLIRTGIPAWTASNAFVPWINFNLTDITTGKFFYPKEKTDYIAVVEYDATQIATPVDSNYIYFVFSDSKYPWSAMKYVMDSTGAPRYSTILGKTAESDWSTSGFTNQYLTPQVRLNVLPFRASSTPIVLDANNKIEIMPNPVGREGYATINVELENATEALFRVMSIDGRLMAEQNLSNFKTHNIQLEVANYPSGTYLVQILTPQGIMTKKFVKAE